ncbi:trimethylamine methyltransferase family protein [Desulforhopalus singaporensis]|uniref:Trimethylamine---corrinoid protein Co-methyltransferase n=1 Tax=Desulforhopalus singaporensis TaxID=91360 RepID=A0A1H0KKX3_9BACT|nr:trimethylamine methyltransferase family protein [Desulforhopalus singaporensis]SDO56597.1 trimethylamine---corrinoid protein Co-methyltransferase [Desulforhopalus singaporensis]
MAIDHINCVCALYFMSGVVAPGAPDIPGVVCFVSVRESGVKTSDSGKWELGMRDSLDKIHQTSMSLIENVGVRLHHREIVELVRNSSVKVVGDVVFFTRKQLMAEVEKIPAQFRIFGRNSKYDMVIGNGSTEYSAGYGCPSIINGDGTRRNGLMADYVNLLKLVHVFPGFHLNGGILVQPSDISVDKANLLMTYATAAFSDKCIMGQPGTAEEVAEVMAFLNILFGEKSELIDKPRIIALVNTLSPMQIDRNSLDTISLYASHGQPLVISSGVMTGTTSPATLAGSIAQANAEALVGMAIAQMIRAETPVVMGINATPVDMRTGGVNVGSPLQAIALKYCVGLARMYGVPIRCGGASSNANGVTAQSGYESMLNMFVTLDQEVDLIIHSAGILDGYSAMSYEKFITDLEVIGLAERYFRDITINEDSLARDVIEEVVGRGQFLTHRHTMNNCRKESWISDIATSGTLTDAVSPCEQFSAKINTKLKKMLGAYEVPFLEQSVHDTIKSFLRESGVRKTDMQHVQAMFSDGDSPAI